MRLLIVDDSSIVRRIIERHFRNHAITEIYEASNGQKALEVYREKAPDLVTMDITMPEMDGLSAVRHIMEINPKARILVISALADAATAVEAVKLGARGFLCKPFTAAELDEAFVDILEISAA
ncbi:MAG: response regulator [Candidatus Methylacidiphilales bacterium]|nr:response regulator [Candidatus Methylacidiphilales bacterium]